MLNTQTMKRFSALALAGSLALSGLAVGVTSANAAPMPSQTISIVNPDADPATSGTWGKIPWTYDTATKTLELGGYGKPTLVPENTEVFLTDGADQQATKFEMETVHLHGVTIEDAKQLTSMFADAKHLKTVTGLNSLNFEKVAEGKTVSFMDMFKYTAVEDANFAGINMAGHDINASGMFQGATSKYLNLTNLPVDHIVTADAMYAENTNLTEVTYGGFSGPIPAPALKSANAMFKDCTNVTSLYMNVEAPNLEQTNEMFDGCKSVKRINFDFVKAQHVKSAQYMFRNCENLEDAWMMSSDFSHLSKAEAMGMFENANKVSWLILPKASLDNLYEADAHGYSSLPRTDQKDAQWGVYGLEGPRTFGEWAADQTISADTTMNLKLA
ncbi:hypothetical protein D2E26_0183 [Bifidobacterium dolichotidis]|uniref:BspA family leucine-rich repeat surface protein n=1 Tax=Bifidobacterium dolichotidis TaxID=2306976 RepID=A0A430FRX9_9BIFI|nr:BspA family leucine-rich repeat surface protein [Bifidobacterium dolichotidis]RSX55620.1 hypothetical protein D2E26_0183 [Bifidobacterium dolichotidis]